MAGNLGYWFETFHFSDINNFSSQYCPKKLEKQDQNKPKAKRRNEIIDKREKQWNWNHEKNKVNKEKVIF